MGAGRRYRRREVRDVSWVHLGGALTEYAKARRARRQTRRNSTQGLESFRPPITPFCTDFELNRCNRCHRWLYFYFFFAFPSRLRAFAFSDHFLHGRDAARLSSPKSRSTFNRLAQGGCNRI